MNTSLLNAAPLRVGLIGWGYASQVFHGPLITSTPGLQLVAVSSRQPERVRADLGAAVAVHAEPAQLIARTDLDVVVIPTPNDTHYPLALTVQRLLEVGAQSAHERRERPVPAVQP